MSSQPATSELVQGIKVSSQNFDELVKRSHWLIRSNQRALSQKLLDDLLAFANINPAPHHLIQAHHAYGRYFRYCGELDAAKLHSDKLLELIEKGGVTDVEKALVYAFCGELASITVNANNDNDFKTAIALCEKGLALVGHLEYSPIKTSCKYCIEQSLSAFNRNTDYERTRALPKIRQLWYDALANNDSLNSLKIGLKVLDYCRGLSLPDSAKVTADRLTKLLAHYRNDEGEISLLNMKHAVAVHQGEVEEGQSYLNKAIMFAKTGDFHGKLQHLYIQRSFFFQGLNDYKNAKLMYDSALLAAPGKLTGHINWLIAKLYREQGNLDSALVYLDKNLSYRDDDFIKKQAEMVEEFKVKYQTQEKEIALQKHRFQSNLLILIASIVVLIALMLACAYRKQKIAQEKLRAAQETVENINEQLRIDKQIISKQAETLRELDEVKSRFFANVSHELRTPLTLLLGPIGSVLKSAQLDDRSANLLQKAQHSGKDLLHLINEILDLSKMESGRMELHEKPVLLGQLLRRWVSQFESYAQAQGLELVLAYRASEQLQVLLDAEKFEKVVNNLLSNAVKFTQKGGRVTMHFEEFDSKLLFSVTDTGQGIHPGDLSKVFDRFYQTSQPGAPAQGGTGIGLALINEYAHLFGGTTWVHSELGKGSTFFFEFPKKTVAAGDWEPLDTGETPEETAPLPALLATDQEATSTATRPTVLIVEDNRDMRDYLRLILEKKYNVLTAENGQVAWAFLQSISPQSAVNPDSDGQETDGLGTVDLIISDLMMPVMDGYQLLEKLKSDDRWRHRPVVMLTARADLRDKLKALRIGVDDYLLKPFEEEELLVRIENLLANSRNRQSITDETSDDKTNAPLISQADADWLAEIERLARHGLNQKLLSVNWLSVKANLSERQFRRRLQNLTGLAPQQYLVELRLHEARALLEAGKYRTVAEVAYAIGYSDAAAFSRSFRNCFGKSPSDYLPG